MDVSRIIAEIDSQIAKLQQARELLSGSGSSASQPSAKRGRKPKAVALDAVAKPARKRNLSPEGRKAIADAMKRRWAARRTQKAEGK